jgi:transcriptional regulator with XRE-family HTH domain
MIGLSQTALAESSDLGLSTVVDFERERREVSDRAIAAMQAALEAAGVVFIPENGNGPGVALRKS